MRFAESIRRAAAYFIVVLPSLLLVLLVVNISLNVVRINSLSRNEDMVTDVERYLSGRKVEAFAVPSGSGLKIGYYSEDDHGRMCGAEREIAGPFPGDVKKILVYGSSPVISSFSLFSGRVKTFPEILEGYLDVEGKRVKVYNLGLTSVDSFGIKSLFSATLKELAPDLVVYFYEGGMDLENAYRAVGAKSRFYPLRLWNGDITGGGMEGRDAGFLRVVSELFAWLNRGYIQPQLINFLQYLGVLHINRDVFDAIDRLVLRAFGKNMKEFSRSAVDAGVQVVFVAAPDNLEAMPYGIFSETKVVFDKGMSEEDTEKRLELLRAARDAEIFTGDIGARSASNELIRSMADEEQGVYVYDLAAELQRAGIVPGNDLFIDHGHMNPSMHSMVAKKLAAFLEQKGLL